MPPCAREGITLRTLHRIVHIFSRLSKALSLVMQETEKDVNSIDFIQKFIVGRFVPFAS